MKIKYSKQRLSFNVLLGVVFILSGALKWYEGRAESFNYIQLLLGVLMVVTFFIEKYSYYIRIENGLLTKNFLIKKTIQINEINEIKSLPGRIKLFTDNKRISLNTSIIEDNSLKSLYRVLGSLELDPKKNPYIGWAQVKS